MALALTIAGVNRTANLRAGSLRLQSTADGKQGVADFTLKDLTPADNATAVIVDGATTYYSGWIRSRSVDEVAVGHWTCKVSCQDDASTLSPIGAAPWAFSDTPNNTTTFPYLTLGMSIVSARGDSYVGVTTTGTVTTRRSGIKPGHTLTITSANHGLSAAPFYVVAVETSFPTSAPVWTIRFGDPPIKLVDTLQSSIGGAVDDAAAALAISLKSPKVVATLPTLPDAAYPLGTIAFLTTNGKIYRVIAGNLWSKEVDGADLLVASITAGAISAGAIGTDALAANSVVAGKIAAGAVVAGKIAADAVTATEIAAYTITADNLAAGSVAAYQLQADAVTADKIAAGAITADDITVGTLTGITITGSNIYAGGGGFDGLRILDASSQFQGSWAGDGGLLAEGVIYSSQYVKGVQGVVTVIGYGSGSFPVAMDGMLGVDYGSAPARLYAYVPGIGWDYVSMVAGFTVPVEETICPVCETEIKPGDDLIGQGDRYDADGALHGLWKHLACAGQPLGPLADQYWAAGKDPALRGQLEADALKASKVVVPEWAKKPPRQADPPPIDHEAMRAEAQAGADAALAGHEAAVREREHKGDAPQPPEAG